MPYTNLLPKRLVLTLNFPCPPRPPPPALLSSLQSVTKQAGPYGRPILFALSNPTSKSELSFNDAVTWSQGRAVYASGSPYEPLVYDPSSNTTEPITTTTSSSSSSSNSSSRNSSSGSSRGSMRLLRPAQANNCLVFPGLGLGCVASGASDVNDDMLLATAKTIAGKFRV